MITKNYLDHFIETFEHCKDLDFEWNTRLFEKTDSESWAKILVERSKELRQCFEINEENIKELREKINQPLNDEEYRLLAKAALKMYQDGYDDICRIFITKETHDFYRDICIAIEDLKADIDRMGRAHKKPSDYGIRVRNSEDLSITARNKMQNTKTKIDRHSFYGCLYETPYLHADSNIMKDNIDRTLEFMNEIDVSKLKAGYTYPYFDNIPVELVKELLSKIKVHEANANFDTKQLLSFLNKHDEIKTFNVLFMGGGGASFEFENIYGQSFPQFNSVSRNFDLRNNKTIVRMSSIRAHLWGPSDPAYGLTKEQREEVIKKHPERNPSAAMYLDEYDNPLLIIYFVTPIGISANDTNTDEGKFRTKLQQEKELRYRFLVGYAIGFPSKDGQKDDAVLYTVNEKVNYYDKMHEEDEAEVFEE